MEPFISYSASLVSPNCLENRGVSGNRSRWYSGSRKLSANVCRKQCEDHSWWDHHTKTGDTTQLRPVKRRRATTGSARIAIGTHVGRPLRRVVGLWIHYVEVRKDELRTQTQKLVLKLVVAVLAGVAAATAVVVAIGLALIGLADLIGSQLGGRYWAGKLVVGFGLIAVIAAAVAVYKSRYIRSLRTKTLAKYEHRHQLQRQRFGRDVDRNDHC